MSQSKIRVWNLGLYFHRPRKSRWPTFDTSAPDEFVRLDRKEWVLKGINLSVDKGETIAVLGRNGAGKTTLMRVLEGSLLPDRGSCVTDTRPISMSSLMTGFDGQSSVVDNLKSLGHLRGLRSRDLDEFAREVIDFAGLVDKTHHPYKMLSTGMKSRLGFSFAHIFEPDILLVDEGFANGDRWFVDKSQKSISRYLSSGKTVLMTSHSEKLLKETCSRGVVLKRGRVVFDGPIDKAFVAYYSDG